MNVQVLSPEPPHSTEQRLMGLGSSSIEDSRYRDRAAAAVWKLSRVTERGAFIQALV